MTGLIIINLLLNRLHGDGGKDIVTRKDIVIHIATV